MLLKDAELTTYRGVIGCLCHIPIFLTIMVWPYDCAKVVNIMACCQGTALMVTIMVILVVDIVMTISLVLIILVLVLLISP